MADKTKTEALRKRPQSTATPLGTKKERNKSTKKSASTTEKVVDSTQTSEVKSENQQQTAATTQPAETNNETQRTQNQETTNMQITLSLDTTPRKGRAVIYKSDQLRGAVRFPRNAFSAEPPASITLDAEGLAERPRKMTPEERKEARKNAPKLTAAEKLQRAEARIAKLREKADKEASAPAGGEQPAQG
jgi:C1A family cysteine protease